MSRTTVKNPNAPTKSVRCAIYTRKSTEVTVHGSGSLQNKAFHELIPAEAQKSADRFIVRSSFVQ